MSLAVGATLFGRALAERNMQSTCIIRRATPGSMLNPETGNYDPELTPIYDGPCKLDFDDNEARDVDAQAQMLAEQSPMLKLPVNAASAGIRPDDVGELTAHPLDPSMVGLTFRITGRHTRTFATSRRLRIEVTT